MGSPHLPKYQTSKGKFNITVVIRHNRVDTLTSTNHLAAKQASLNQLPGASDLFDATNICGHL